MFAFTLVLGIADGADALHTATCKAAGIAQHQASDPKDAKSEPRENGQEQGQR